MEDRFWQHVDKRGPDECWEYMGARSPKGYGIFQRGRGIGVIISSRLAFELSTGNAPEKWVLHKCDNPPCCNPAHLYDGTPSQNNLDMYGRGRRDATKENRPRGSKHHNSKLTEDDVRFIRSSSLPKIELARMFGVNRQTIYRVLDKEWWKHVADEEVPQDRKPLLRRKRPIRRRRSLGVQ